MGFDGSKSATLNEAMIVYQSVPEDFTPRITIGMPTFRRPETIGRALASLAKQTFSDFVLVVSDNAGRVPATLEAVEDYAAQLPGVILVAQPENLGALGNFHYLLSVADTEFFMWLADDDEITETYLEDLLRLLEEDPQAVGAMGRWKSMTSASEGYNRRLSHHAERSQLLRAAKYVAGPTEDAFFYGLHRTECLRQCSFDAYVFPNKEVLTDFCFVLLFDLILQGPIRYADTADWKDHNYSEKQYHTAKAQGVYDRIRTLARRINVYGLYCIKAYKKNPILLPVVFIASVYGLLYDMLTAVIRISSRQFVQRRRS